MLDETECETDPGYGRDCHRTVGSILDYLDPEEEALVEPMSLAVRFYYGVVDHLRLRTISWIMSLNMVVFGLILLANPDAMSLPGRTVIYADLLRIASEHSWGLICVAVGGFRLVALFINGTFPTFPWSPWMRALGSFLACLFWLQIELGAIQFGELILAVDIYAIFLLFDAVSLYTAALEMDPLGDGGA